MQRLLKFRVWHYDANQIIYESYPGEVFQWLKEKQPIDVMQYTGLKDKNGLTDIYEGDIISLEGEIIGNVYEKQNRCPTDLVVAGMGTSAWRNTEQAAVERGCKYTE